MNTKPRLTLLHVYIVDLLYILFSIEIVDNLVSNLYLLLSSLEEHVVYLGVEGRGRRGAVGVGVVRVQVVLDNQADIL